MRNLRTAIWEGLLEHDYHYRYYGELLSRSIMRDRYAKIAILGLVTLAIILQFGGLGFVSPVLIVIAVIAGVLPASLGETVGLVAIAHHRIGQVQLDWQLLWLECEHHGKSKHEELRSTLVDLRVRETEIHATLGAIPIRPKLWSRVQKESRHFWQEKRDRCVRDPAQS